MAEHEHAPRGGASLACAAKLPGYFLRLMIRPRLFPVMLLTLTACSFAQDGQLPNTLTMEEKAEGWRLLFDGKALSGLQGLQKRDFLKEGWEIKDGVLSLPKTVRQSGKPTGGDLVTSEQFGDFEFRFDFKLAASAISGVLYFARGGLGQKPTGHEFMVIDDVHFPKGLKGGPLFHSGALTGVLPPKAGTSVRIAERPDEEEWNEGRINVQGNHVEHWLNGEKVLEYDCGSLALKQAVTKNEAKVHAMFGTKIKSSLAILDKGEEVAFRNLKVRTISSTPPPPLAAPAMPATPPPPAVAPAKPAWQKPPPPPPPILK